MSMKLMKADGKSKKPAVMAGKSGSTSASWQRPAPVVQPKPHSGKADILAMTESDAMELLARIQDICALYPDSHNKIMGEYLLIALPIPPAMTFSKLVMADNRTVFCVNGKAVTEIMAK